MKKTLTLLVLISIFFSTSCMKRLTEKKVHRYTNKMELPDDLFKTTLLVHFIDSISPKAIIGSSSWDMARSSIYYEITRPYKSESIDETMNKYEMRLVRTFNKLVPRTNAQLLQEIANCKVKCVPFRKADFYTNIQRNYNPNEYKYVLIRSITYLRGNSFIIYEYSLYDRINNVGVKIPYNSYTVGLGGSMMNERIVFRKFSYEYLKRFPE
jgi:hypothetical protein